MNYNIIWDIPTAKRYGGTRAKTTKTNANMKGKFILLILVCLMVATCTPMQTSSAKTGNREKTEVSNKRKVQIREFTKPSKLEMVDYSEVGLLTLSFIIDGIVLVGLKVVKRKNL